jgi:nucleotide-binding universal stress UspA family protein
MTTIRQPIVVGFDDSAGAKIALDWAIREASARNAPLRVVYAVPFAPQLDNVYREGEPPAPLAAEARHLGTDVLADARRYVAERARNLSVTLATSDAERPAHAFVRESLNASMVVLGSRHLGAVASAFLGSTGSAVAQRAACPVIVVRGPAGDPAEGARVVVGVDGSSPSEAALAFAFDHAAAHGLPLEAILCWHPDLLAEMSWRPEQPAPKEAHALVSEVVAGWREKYPDVVVSTNAVRDHPAAGLVAASTAQNLLVVGRHGRHGPPGVVLGSTSMGVLHHATCPVAIVPVT